MRRAFDRWAAPSLLGAGGLLAAVSTLFSMGSSNGRLVWIGLAALVVAAVLGAVAFLGLPRPVLRREAVAAVALLAAFVAWNGLSVLWSIEPDRSWDYFNRGLVYLALAVVGVAVGSLVPRSARAWAYVLAAALALPLGWALLTKAVPAIGSDTGRVARLSAPVGYWNSLGLLFAMALPLALWLAARREHAHWLRALGVVYAYALAGRAAADLLARRRARRRGRGRALARARAAAGGERGGAAARRRGRAGRGRVGVLAAGARGGRAGRIRFACTTARGSRSCSFSARSRSGPSRTSARSSRSGGR